MVYRIYVEKQQKFAHEAQTLLKEVRSLLDIHGLEAVRILNRYDAEEITAELFADAVQKVFSEPQVDVVTETPDLEDAVVFAVEYLPGQFDQRADSAAQCIQIISTGERPIIRSAKVYALYGSLTDAELAEIKKYVINPVEAREAVLQKPETLHMAYDLPEKVETLTGFCELDAGALSDFVRRYGLVMDVDDLTFCRNYFRSEERDPTITEIRVIDTYWSDHCRHTTFHTIIDAVDFEDPVLQKAWADYLAVREELNRTKPICLMDLGTIAVKYLKAHGKLDKLDESEEVNACTVKINVTADGVTEPWLLLFKNETHNHPTEIEPFGGAATCIGGAIRDPLSGRSYVYGAMRLTGAADPTAAISETIPGKLPQRKIVTSAAAGYSSYGNQIGLATGIVDEWYHPGYAAKRMEIGAVIAAAPAENVRREVPAPGDKVILLGGSTGRDGIGGATGSSKAHTVSSVETCGAEVQKGNAPEERKLQRLFRNPAACKMIKRCNDFGAGGVSVAIGELADGLSIDLNQVPKKYEGLDGTELAISESQERMAVVVEAKDVPAFLTLAEQENLQACVVAEVTEDPRLVMRWNDDTIVDISRTFLDTNGAEKHIAIRTAPAQWTPKQVTGSFPEVMCRIAGDLNCCSRRGLAERFDSTIGAGSVLMPFGGKHQKTPVQAMVQKIAAETKETDDCSLMSWGFNPYISEQSPYHGAYLAVVESVCKLIAGGAAFEDVYLTFQEYFAKPGKDPTRWGQPLSALLGAFKAQMDLGIGAIGGKDSMSGTFEQLDVPPTLVSFAVTTGKIDHIVSPEFKQAGHVVLMIRPDSDENGLPKPDTLLRIFKQVTKVLRSGRAVSCYTPGAGGLAEAIIKMSAGNGFGFYFTDWLEADQFGTILPGAFILELSGDCDQTKIFTDWLEPALCTVLGVVMDDDRMIYKDEAIDVETIMSVYEGRLESVYPMNVPEESQIVADFDFTAKEKIAAPAVKSAKPTVLIPAFPGTNCEFDSARAVRDAGAQPEIFVINNLNAEGIRRSVDRFAEKLKTAQMLFIPGGFSGGDEPDGSAKFITAFFRNPMISEGVMDLLNKRDGLICGICNGFQALIKLGLVPYGKIMDTDAASPTLTFNTIGRHQSKLVRTRVASNRSPWLSLVNVGDVFTVPISHGEGRFIADDALIKQLAAKGQIATQYADLEGNPSMDIQYNPNGSIGAIEGITSPDGRVFGKMGHSERVGRGLYQNVPGEFDIRMFEAAVKYFK